MSPTPSTLTSLSKERAKNSCTDVTFKFWMIVFAVLKPTFVMPRAYMNFYNLTFFVSSILACSFKYDFSPKPFNFVISSLLFSRL